MTNEENLKLILKELEIQDYIIGDLLYGLSKLFEKVSFDEQTGYAMIINLIRQIEEPKTEGLVLNLKSYVKFERLIDLLSGKMNRKTYDLLNAVDKAIKD